MNMPRGIGLFQYCGPDEILLNEELQKILDRLESKTTKELAKMINISGSPTVLGVYSTERGDWIELQLQGYSHDLYIAVETSETGVSKLGKADDLLSGRISNRAILTDFLASVKALMLRVGTEGEVGMYW